MEKAYLWLGFVSSVASFFAWWGTGWAMILFAALGLFFHIRLTLLETGASRRVHSDHQQKGR